MIYSNYPIKINYVEVPMKLGYLSAILPEYRFEQVVDYAAQLGLRAVDLACWPV